MQELSDRFVFGNLSPRLVKSGMDWQQRARRQMKDRQWTGPDVCERYDTAALRRGMQRVTKAGKKSPHTLTPGGLSHWLNGKREPRMSEFLCLTEALGMTPIALLVGNNPLTPITDEARIREAVKYVLEKNPAITRAALEFRGHLTETHKVPKILKRRLHITR